MSVVSIMGTVSLKGVARMPNNCSLAICRRVVVVASVTSVVGTGDKVIAKAQVTKIVRVAKVSRKVPINRKWWRSESKWPWSPVGLRYQVDLRCGQFLCYIWFT